MEDAPQAVGPLQCLPLFVSLPSQRLTLLVLLQLCVLVHFIQPISFSGNRPTLDGSSFPLFLLVLLSLFSLNGKSITKHFFLMDFIFDALAPFWVNLYINFIL